MARYPRNQTGRSSSGASFGMHSSYNKKRNYGPRNPPTPFRPQETMPFDARANSRYDIGSHGPLPPHFGGLEARPSRHFSNFNSQPFRPYDTRPPAVPYDFPPQPFYPFVPYGGFGDQFRRSAEHGYPEFPNKLFLEEYRFPGPHPVYQPPNFGAVIHPAHLDQAFKIESPCELDGRPLAQSIKLRGDAPEFVPGCKPAAEEEGKATAKEPCWLVVSSA